MYEDIVEFLKKNTDEFVSHVSSSITEQWGRYAASSAPDEQVNEPDLDEAETIAAHSP